MNVPWQWWTERSINPYFLYNRHAPTGSKIFTAKDYSYAEAVPRLVQPTNDPYQGKVIILANRFSASAAEDFIMAFKDTHRGVIIGESTWGSTGMQYRYDFGNGINIHIGTIRSYFPDGAPFEGVGIEPDIPVNFTRDDYYKDRDPVLLKALDMARTFSRSSAIR
jgi:carboxyl-terminal processing protease